MSNLGSPLRTLVTDFRSGELDPRLMMRVDSKIYPSGARSLRNCLLANTGSAARRPGSTWLMTFSARPRLVCFDFDADEKYILAFASHRLDIIAPSGTVLQTFTGSTDCPWDGTSYHVFTTAQVANTMILAHEDWKPRVLKRTSLNTFTIAPLSFARAPNNAVIYQPYDKLEDADTTLALSSTAAGAGITVTASQPIFSAAWVNDRIRIYGIELLITAYTDTTHVTATAEKTVKKRLDPNPFLYADGSTTVEVTQAFHGLDTGASVTFSGAIDGFNIVRADINGARTVTVTDEDHYTFVAGGAAANASVDTGGSSVYVRTTAPTREWEEAVFNSRRGWPGAVCFHEDRLWFGGSTWVPDGIWSSKTSQYYNFDVSDGEDDASIQLSIGSSRGGKIVNLMSNRVLQVFSDTGEYVVKQSDGAGLTPANVSVRVQTNYGSHRVAPRSFDGATMFAQANRKTVREFLYDFSQDAFNSTDLTTLSSHLLSQISGLDVMYGSDTRTEQYAFVTNSDGSLAVFHSARSEQLAAWVPWDTPNGSYVSLVVLGSEVFVATLRGVSYHLERIELDDPGVTLDFSVSLTNGSPQTVWTLGATWAGMTVHVTSGDWYLGTFVADGSGVITLDTAMTSITAGLWYEWEVVPLPPDAQMPDGPMTGIKRRVAAVTVHLYDTMSVSVNGKPIITAQAGDDPSVPSARVTGKYRRFLTGYNRDPAVSFTQAAPLAVTILGCIMEVSS